MDTAVNLSRLVWGDDARRALSYKGGHLRCVFGVLISPCSLEVFLPIIYFATTRAGQTWKGRSRSRPVRNARAVAGG